MDATLTESEALLKEMATRLAADLGAKAVPDLEELRSEAAWKALAHLGLLALRAPGDAGGGDGTTADTAIVVEALAGGLLAAPYLGSAALVTELLLAAGAPGETIAAVSGGDLRLGVGFSDDLTGLGRVGQTTLAPDASGSTAVLCLEDAFDGAGVTLTARSAGESDRDLDLTREWVTAEADQPADVGHLGGPIERSALQGFECRALTLVSADLVGISEAALGQAVEYAKGRVQFGVPIGSFQAVQHLCGEQAVTIAGMRALVYYAAWAADHLPTGEALLAARTAKAYCSSGGTQVTEAVVQVFGGMGITWECLAHVALKRALLDAAWLGDERHQLKEIAKLRAGMAG